jgi:hypothetical protein
MMDETISAYLAGVSLGTPATHGSMTVFPVFSPPISNEHEYLTMAEAMDHGVLQITEVSEAGSVPELMAENKGTAPILIIDGEALVGSKQDRVANTTMLLAPESKTAIPVSCTEQGRWRYTSHEFSSADFHMSSESRRRKMRSVSESLKQNGSFASDQGGVWDSCASLNRKTGARSASGAMRDSFDAKRQEIGDLVCAFPIQPHQRGVLVIIYDLLAVGFEMISREDVFPKIYKKLLNSYAIDAVLEQPSHRKVNFTAAANTFLADIRNCSIDPHLSVGLGTDYRFTGIGMVGHALVHEGVPVFMSFSAMKDSTRQPNAERMAGFRERRSHTVQRNAEV